jgi:saccharopine dehydrogenase-like NADP-dependent oxidoreductase
MRILLLGTGMQGRTALHDLAASAGVTRVVAADRDVEALRDCVRGGGYGAKVECRRLDAAEPAQLDRLMAEGFDVAIDLLPSAFIAPVAAAAIRYGVHLVNTMYVTPELEQLAAEAKARSVTILPEFGMDPGLDLVLLGEAVRGFEEVTDILSYGAGIPEPRAADNLLKYKVSWTLEGVLRAYRRSAQLIRNGVVVEVGATEQFLPEHVHEVAVEGVGALEAYPNGDAVHVVRLLGLPVERLRRAGRYTMRYPGHCAFWRALVALHLLDDDPVVVDGVSVDRKRFLAAVLEPQLRYGDDERDLAIIRLEVEGTRAGARERVVYQVIDRRDLGTGLTAMSRLVGYTASIGAQMIAAGAIARRGLLSPVTDVPCEPLVRALAERGITVTRVVTTRPSV